MKNTTLERESVLPAKATDTNTAVAHERGAELRAFIEVGVASGIAPRGVEERVLRRIRERAATRAARSGEPR